MPAETHQHGQRTGRGDILVLLAVLLGGSIGELPGDATLSSLGVEDAAALWDLWDVVREELAERTIGPADGADALDTTMTVDEAASVLERLLVSCHDDEDSVVGEQWREDP